MSVNHEVIELITEFIWSGDTEYSNAIRQNLCNEEKIYSNEFVALSYKKLLEHIIENGCYYDSNKCLYNASS